MVIAAILATTTASMVYAQDITFNETKQFVAETTKEDILSKYHRDILEVSNNSSVSRNSITTIAQIQKETVQKLTAAGYDAYDVNPQTFKKVENVLSTDLEKIGLKPDNFYVIVIEGGTPSESASFSSAGASFNYTYNGTTYKLRYMTITAADDPAMGKASEVDVLKSKSSQAIENCLDTLISIYISSINSKVGTVASLCGLSVSNFGTAQESTLSLNGGTNWTRKYTQVWSDYDQSWLYGSCVEYVTSVSYMSGLYYSATENKYVAVPRDSKEHTEESKYYNNTSWQKENAVLAYLNSRIQYDTVGDVKYKYGDSVKITHREDF